MQNMRKVKLTINNVIYEFSGIFKNAVPSRLCVMLLQVLRYTFQNVATFYLFRHSYDIAIILYGLYFISDFLE